jgi:hypothetical protein
MELKFNLNDWVKVKLTDKGKNIYYHQFDAINQTYEKQIIKPHYPELTEDGYYKTQLWCLMNLFGEHLYMGFDPPFGTEIILCK